MKIIKILCEITIDVFNNFKYFVKKNLVAFANILNLVVPYIMYLVGQQISIKRGYFSIGGEIFIPLAFAIIIFYLKTIANKIGKGLTIPLPEKRFTEVDDDGEVSVENRRIQELILYIADLEDWLEKKNLL